jgi:hypothetical protein
LSISVLSTSNKNTTCSALIGEQPPRTMIAILID